MYISQKVIAAFFAALIMLQFGAGPSAAAAPAAPSSSEVIATPWTQRCSESKDKKKYCEIFQRLEIKGNGERVAEFAISLRDVKEGSAARGMVILPLNILLEEGVSMTIDNGSPYVFKNRFCNNGGCFSYINVSKNLMDALKAGKVTKFSFKNANGGNINIVMKMDGFEKALKELH